MRLGPAKNDIAKTKATLESLRGFLLRGLIDLNLLHSEVGVHGGGLLDGLRKRLVGEEPLAILAQRKRRRLEQLVVKARRTATWQRAQRGGADVAAD